MATKQRTADSADQPNPAPRSERDREDAKERAAAKAKQVREDAVSSAVSIALGCLTINQRMTCSEVGKGRYRINLLEKKLSKDSEFLEETHIAHSWMVWHDGTKIHKSMGDVPLERTYKN